MHAISRVAFIAAVLYSLAYSANAAADDPTTVSCDGFVLSYSGQVDKQTCTTEDLSNGRASGHVSRIEIRDNNFYLVATYYRSGIMTYYADHSLRELVDGDKSFSRVMVWQTLPDTDGFAVAAFAAALSSNNKTVACAIFASYSGTTTSHAEYTDGPGYKNLFTGYYCPRGGFASTTAGSEAMTTLQDRLGRLRISQ